MGITVAVAAGTLLGVLSGLGVGGGSLLLLWLTAVMGMDAQQARLINLMFFLPSALITSVFRFRQGTLNLKLVGSALITGCAGAYWGTLWRTSLDPEILRRILGAAFVLCGIRELLYRPKEVT